MVVTALPGGSPAITSYSNASGSRFTSSFTTANATPMANGVRNIYITYMSLYVAGRSGTVTIRGHFAGFDHGTFNAAAQSTPSLKNLPINRQSLCNATFQYGFTSTGPVNFRRSNSGLTERDGGASTWPGSLSGSYSYAVPPPAPTPTGVDQATKNSLRARFSSAGDGGSPITGWVLQYSKSSSFPSGSTTTVSSTGTTTVTGLDSATTYYFRAAGRNIVTDNASTYGPWSSTFSGATTAGTPNAPTLTLSPVGVNTFKLDWTIPANGGSAITGYDVQRSKNSDFSDATTDALGVVNTWTSPTLDAGTWYFRVRAKNANGNGTWSASKSNTVTLSGEVTVRMPSAWIKRPLKVYVGGSWVVKPVKYWNGSSWITLT